MRSSALSWHACRPPPTYPLRLRAMHRPPWRSRTSPVTALCLCPPCRSKNLYRSNPTAMINWDKEERPGKRCSHPPCAVCWRLLRTQVPNDPL